MVSYEQWVSLAFEVAPEGPSAPNVLSRAGELWSQNKEGAQAASVSEARDFLRNNL